MKAKKILTGTLIATMLISSLLTGCSKNDTSDNSSEEITTEAEATSTDTTESADKNDKADSNTVSSVGTANADTNKKEAESSSPASNTTNSNKTETNQQTQTVATANNQGRQTTEAQQTTSKTETTEAPATTEAPTTEAYVTVPTTEATETTEAPVQTGCTADHCAKGWAVYSSVPTDGEDHGYVVCVNGVHYSRTGRTDRNTVVSYTCSFCHEIYYGDEYTGHSCEAFVNGGCCHSYNYRTYWVYQ